MERGNPIDRLFCCDVEVNALTIYTFQPDKSDSIWIRHIRFLSYGTLYQLVYTTKKRFANTGICLGNVSLDQCNRILSDFFSLKL